MVCLSTIFGRLRWAFRPGMAALLAAVAAFLPASPVHADYPSDGYRFKWPWYPDADVVITGYPYTDHHGCSGGGSCTDAYDFVISDRYVRSSGQGTVIQRVSHLQTPDDCYNPSLGLGNYVEVDVPGFSANVVYAHLESVWAPLNGETIWQGDEIGLQGCTGHTTGEHLHFEFRPSSPSNPQRPDKIDGQSTKPLVPPPESSNSAIGMYSQQGAALRAEYGYEGSWSGVGWTSDIEGVGNEGLWMRRDAPRVAGWRQTFLHDPYYFCTGESGIYVSDLDWNEGYWVDICTWNGWHEHNASNWEQKGLRATGFPFSGMHSVYCPSELPQCTKLQAFYFGYVWWREGATAPESVACPDVNTDGVVNILDVHRVALHMGQGTNDQRCDVNADTTVNILDVQKTAGIFGSEPNKPCYQREAPGRQACPPP